MNDEVPVLTISQNVFVCAPMAETPEFEPSDDPEGPIMFFIRKFCMMEGNTDYEKMKTPLWTKRITAHSTEEDCFVVFVPIGRPSSRCNINGGRVLLSVFRLKSVSERPVPTSLRTCFHQFCHNSLLYGHLGEYRVYNFLRKTLYSPHLANDVYGTVRDSRAWGHNHTDGKRQQHLNHFIREGQLGYMCMDVLAPLPKSKQGNQYLVMMTDRNTKFTKPRPTLRI